MAATACAGSNLAGLHYGKNVRDFLDGLVERRLARRRLFLPNRGHVYHLHAKSLYRPLDQTDNRNRRRASAPLIARKLMLLDVVLSRPDADRYATEDDKVRLFRERFTLPMQILPRRTVTARRRSRPSTTRYFMDKLPICVALDPPTVCFVYLALDQTTADFRRFLVDHAELLARLPSWRVVLPGPSPFVSRAAYSAACERFMSGPLPVAAASPTDLRRYFRTADAVARNDLASLSVADIDRFRRLRQPRQSTRRSKR